MLSNIFSLVVGSLLLLIGLSSCVILIYFRYNAKLNEFALITLSDSISTTVTGVFFVLNYSHTFELSDICEINSVMIKFGMTMIPLMNGFLSMLALNYECSNYAKRTCQAKFEPKQKKSLSVLPQWLIPIASFVYLATLKPEQVSLRPTETYEQCVSHPIFSTLHKTQCQNNETINQSQANKYAMLTDKFVSTLINENFKYNLPPLDMKNINLQNKTNEIVSNVYKLMSMFQNKTERNSSKRSETITAQPIPYSQNLSQYIDFLTSALKIVHQRPQKYKTKENIDGDNINMIGINKTSSSQLQEMVIPTDNSSTSIINDLLEIKNEVRNNNISKPANGDMNIINITPQKNQTSYFFSNNYYTQSNFSNLFKLPNQISNVNTSDPTINSTECLMQCAVSNSSLKRHVFLLLFITYFIPICLTIFVYKNINWDMKEVEGQIDGRKLKNGEKVMIKSRQMTVASFLLLSPSFLEVLLHILLCLQLPDWMSTLFLLVMQVHNAVRNIVNLSMVKLCLENKGNCGQVSPSPEANLTKEIEKESKMFEKTTPVRKVSLASSTVTFENVEDDDVVNLVVKSKDLK